MSVLKKKMSQEAGLPDIVRERPDVWRSMHLELCDQITTLTDFVWEPDNVIIAQGIAKGLISGLPKSGPVFSFRSGDGRIPAIAHFETRIAAHVTSSSLGLALNNDDEDYELERLDLLLFQPIQQSLSSELEKVLGIATSARVTMTQISQGSSVSSLEVPRGPEFWNQITFTIKSCPPEDGDAEAKANFIPTILTFRVVLPESMTLKIASTMQATSETAVQGEAGPWAEEIYRSIETATVPIRAVIESCEMTVAECTRLEINDVIKLPGISLQTVSLETEMNEKPVKIGTASLGIYKSNRALKLSGDLEKGVFVAAQFMDDDAVNVSPG